MSDTVDMAAVDNKIRQVVSNIRNLPTPPIVFHQIQKVMNDPNVSAVQVASILAEDPAMSVKVLKLTNSAFYGLAREVDSVKQAVIIVGLEAIKNLVLSASVLDMFKGEDIDQDFHERHWRHSLSTGFCTRILAKKLKSRGMVSPDSAFSAGLLHDIGKMIISCYLPEEAKKIKQERQSDQTSPDYELEERLLGYNHAQIGGILATQWKLPQRLCESITFHHHPQLDEGEDPVPYLINIANFVAHRTFTNDEESAPLPDLDPHILEYLKIGDGDLDDYSEILREEYLKAETFMQMVGLSA